MAAVALVAGISASLESVRFHISTPSLIDDWFGITYSPPAIDGLLHGDYSSAPIDFPGRYRPAYTAIWNYAQWHLLGGPSVTTAAVWGVVRISLFLAAVYLLAAWLTGERTAAVRPALWLAPLAVALTPGIAVDLARHGAGDPMMLAGLIIGLALVGQSLRMLLDSETQRRGRAIALLALGYVVYLIGVYSKETSICLLVFVPFFLKWLGPRLRTHTPQSRSGRCVLASLGVLLLAPLVHVAVHLAVAVSDGRNPYPGAQFSLGRKVFAAVVLPLLGAPGPMGTHLWLAAVPAAIAVSLIAVRRRHRDAWLLLGVLLTGYAMSAFALAQGDIPSRNYVPWFVAVSAVALRGLTRSHVGVQFAVAALVLAIALSGTRDAIADLATTERSGSTAVEMAEGVVSAGCPIYLANFDVERRVAIPRLFGFGHATTIRSCNEASERAYVVSWEGRPVPVGFASQCRGGWREVVVRNDVTLYECQALHAQAIPDQDAASGSPQSVVVRLRVPPRGSGPETLFQSPRGGADPTGEIPGSY